MTPNPQLRTLSSHIPVIDGLRGLAASSVCFYHFVCTVTGYFTSQLVLDVFYYGKYGVQLFFVISGIVIPLSMMNGKYSHSSWGIFLWKRFIRIEPPYLFSVLLGSLLLIARNYIPGTTPVDLTPTPKELLLHLGYLIPFFDNVRWVNEVYWTLAIEFQYYLFLSLSIPLLLKPRLLLRGVFYFIFLLPPLVFNIADQAFLIKWLPLFLMGIIYAAKFKALVTKYEYWIITLLAALEVVCFEGFTDLIVAVFTISVVHFFADSSNRIALFFGNISYSLYLIHAIVGAAFVNVMSHYFTQTWQKPVVVISGFLISVFSAWIMNKYIEYPSKKMASKIKYTIN